MKFAYTIVYVSDVASSLDFFERAFGLARRFLHDGGYGQLGTGATTLSFASHETARGNLCHDYAATDASALPLGIEVGLVTDDVDAACRRAVRAGAALLTPLTVKPWGQTVGYVRCPDGTLVELCTAVA